MPRLNRVLIANRGEIAVRLARSIRVHGATPVLAHTGDDRALAEASGIDERVLLPGDGPAGYLDLAGIVTAALGADVDAVHPGYGFLSEDARFAKACRDAGLVFIGPGTEHLDRFGDKTLARAAAAAVGIPVLAGTGPDADVDGMRALLAEHGAIVLKAVSGGGGRGMRVVDDPAGLDAAFASAGREAALGGGSASLYAEAHLAGAHHIEVQVIGDGTRAEHLGTRDCTVQRRHQKLVEIAPAPWLDDLTRLRLLDAAVALAESVGYDSLGTIEFLVAGDRLAFLECNARLQVEHTVTEEVTGLDLVALQLRLAEGATLADLGIFAAPPIEGCAVQARVCAETVTPTGAWVPTTGTVTAFSPPSGVRIDTAVGSGTTWSGRYDSLVAKVIGVGATWDEARTATRSALDELVIEGLDTTADLLADLLGDPELATGAIDTGWLERRATPDPGGSDDRGAPSDPTAAPTPAPTSAPTGARSDGAHSDGATVTAPLAGVVVEVAPVGAELAPGQAVAVLESMKMEHVVEAPTGGRVARVAVAVGEVVEAGGLLAELVEVPARAATVVGDDEIDLDRIRDDLAHVRERHAAGLDAARPEAVAKRHRLGKRTARENLDDLLDPGTFVEYGALVVAAQRRRRSAEELRAKTPADGLVGGIGRIGGHSVAVATYDYTVLAGTQGLQNHRKKDRLFDIARERSLPFVLFAEGGGGRPGDTDGTGVAGLDCLAFRYFGELSGRVPLVGIASGRCFAGNAALVGTCDVVIATADANIGMGGPAMIEGGGLGVFRPEEIGPIDEQVAAGVVDVAVADEAEAVAVAKRYLGYFTDPLVEGVDHDDQRRLRHLIPENRVRVYDVRAVIDALCDTDSVLELRRGFGAGMVTALARVGGRAVGLVANDPHHLGGAIDSDASDKLARFLQLCDGHGLPVVSLCDTPGFMVGPEAERTGLVRHASRLFVTAGGLRVPILTIVLRKGYGLGAQAMAGGSFHAPLFVVGWPTSEFGGMGLEGAVRLGYRDELAAIEDPDERQATYQAMVDQMYETGRGTRMAEAFEIDAVIDPADTRRWITEGLATVPVGSSPTGHRTHIDTW